MRLITEMPYMFGRLCVLAWNDLFQVKNDPDQSALHAITSLLEGAGSPLVQLVSIPFMPYTGPVTQITYMSVDEVINIYQQHLVVNASSSNPAPVLKYVYQIIPNALLQLTDLNHITPMEPYPVLWITDLDNHAARELFRQQK